MSDVVWLYAIGKYEELADPIDWTKNVPKGALDEADAHHYAAGYCKGESFGTEHGFGFDYYWKGPHAKAGDPAMTYPWRFTFSDGHSWGVGTVVMTRFPDYLQFMRDMALILLTPLLTVGTLDTVSVLLHEQQQRQARGRGTA